MTDSEERHEPQKTLADLRDQLARHDKPLGFLFGAGTSCAVKIPDDKEVGKKTPLIPTVAKLTEICKQEISGLDAKYATAWASIEERCKERSQDPNIENILSDLRMMLGAVGGVDTLCGLTKTEIETLEESVRKSIAHNVTPDLSAITDQFPHRKLARWLAKASRQNPVEIFTVNYDVLIEHALEVERVPVFDGFVGSYQPFFHADSLRRLESAPGAKWTRLWKMHGSVNWNRIEQDGRFRVVREAVSTHGEMIYPSFQKYDESRQQPYSAFTDRLSRFLEQDDALLVILGFGFGDEHINNLIFGALESRPRTHIYALQFGELADDNDLIKRATQRPNAIVVGAKTGIIGGRRGVWSPIENPEFEDAAFELEDKASDGDDGETKEKQGVMRIGDFSFFCDFLDSMTTR